MSDSTKWHVCDGSSIAIWPNGGVLVLDLNDRIVADVKPTESPDQTLAHARLIAAAGRLRESLENMLGAFDTPLRRMKMPSDFGDEAIASARKALASIKNQD